MMKARKWVAVDFGGPEVLRLIDVDVPDPGPGQVRIDVRAAGARTRILKLAQVGALVVPMARTFGFPDALAALTMLTSPHRPGKLALVNAG